MKKNGFLTFVFACIPGAGQMYYGYMLRGLSLITLFCLFGALSSILSAVVVLAPVVWMFSFFDTYDLIRQLVKGTPKQDSLLLFGNENDLKHLALNHNKVIGWVFIGLGVWALYNNILEPLLSNALYALGIANAWYVTDNIPTAVVAVLLVYLGLKLLGVKGHGSQTAEPMEEIPPYPHNNG